MPPRDVDLVTHELLQQSVRPTDLTYAYDTIATLRKAVLLLLAQHREGTVDQADVREVTAELSKSYGDWDTRLADTRLAVTLCQLNVGDVITTVRLATEVGDPNLTASTAVRLGALMPLRGYVRCTVHAENGLACEGWRRVK